MANFCCSIETEPRTLSEGQLNYAREIAVNIVHTKEPNEVSSVIINETESKPLEAGSMKEAAAAAAVVVLDTNCQCSSSALTIEFSPEECRVKEPLSAPF
ncbi:hypothetical protein CASFOL_001325 [Castilleja foliolosa]|uniref:Uncharacterized protein n=1 Tax=Castilleja foliolosa TaxID=1961234 RepID=A0ABD3EQW2_9LAMI